MFLIVYVERYKNFRGENILQHSRIGGPGYLSCSGKWIIVLTAYLNWSKRGIFFFYSQCFEEALYSKLQKTPLFIIIIICFLTSCLNCFNLPAEIWALSCHSCNWNICYKRNKRMLYLSGKINNAAFVSIINENIFLQHFGILTFLIKSGISWKTSLKL